MQIIQLSLKSGTKNIPLFLGTDMWNSLYEFLEKKFSLYAVFILMDSNVESIYGETVLNEFASHRRFGGILSFPAGENSKCREVMAKLEDELLSRKAGRDTVLVAMGGGVTGDLGGFIAATLHRGLPLIHLPSSVIAQVDSSIGGKVGINHAEGKNLIGSFYHPEAIFLNVNLLKTLPEEEFCNGMAEVIKYAVILNSALWKFLEKEQEKILVRDTQVLEKIVQICAELKISVVTKDEKEAKYRSILNFGHTLGHAIEQASRYRIKHGFAIAAGMLFAARLSNQLLDYPEQNIRRLQDTLRGFNLDHVDVKKYDPDLLWRIILYDKKSRQQKPRFTLIDSDGEPRLFHPVEKKEFESVLAKY